MRKSNSEFKTAFTSEAGGELTNNDYFAFVELDNYACYVLAAGITDFQSTEAAKTAVEHLLLTFEDKPTLSKSILARYMEDTNRRLLAATGKGERLKASVTAVVTNYEEFRYMAAGNVRLRMYRQGRLFTKSSDMSLAKDLIDRNEAAPTALDRHEERHNLYAYLGKPEDFHPYISPKHKLKDGDILALYTGGLWEHVDAQEIDEIFHEASNDPRESLDALEDLLLSRQPANLKSYTAAAIFVNKIYRDPERERKRARRIKIALIILVVLLIVGLIGLFLYYRHQNKVELLERTEAEAIEYIKADNYVRAQESCKSAIDQAKDLGKHEDEKRIRGYLIVVDGITSGDKSFVEKDYLTAYDTYMTAKENSRQADLMGMNYINQRIDQTEKFIYVTDFIALGNKALESGDMNQAELAYYKARDKAVIIHDSDGRKAAIDALNELYDRKAKEKTAGEEKIKQAGAAAVNDAMKKGDELMAKGDVEGAEKAYLEARSIANAGGDKVSRQEAMKSLEQVHQAKAEKELEETKSVEDRNKRFAVATDALAQGDKAFAAGDYISAQVYYQSAVDKFTALDEKAMAEQAETKLGNAKSKQVDSQKTQKSAEMAEADAKRLYATKDYIGARQAALTAKQIYAATGNQAKVDEMNTLLTQIDMDAVIDKNLH